MMVMKMVRRGLAALGIAALANGAALAEPASAQARPALWQVSDRDTTVYLFGTIHLLPKDYAWRTPTFDKAVAGAQSLVVETIIDTKNPQALANEMQRMAIRTDLPPLASRIPAAKHPLLDAAIAKTGLPRAVFDRMETWAAAFVLLGTQFKDLGLTGEAGVETVLRSAFASAGKPVDQLETNAEQLGFFDMLPEAAQLSLLEGALEAPGEMRGEFQSMLAAWGRGDVKKIGATFNDDLSGSPDLREALLRRRNVNWARWIQQRMASPGTVLVAVGAGHLAGPDSVQRQLEARGYKIRRIQ